MFSSVKYEGQLHKVALGFYAFCWGRTLCQKCISRRWPVMTERTNRLCLGYTDTTVDGRNPANQLRLVVYPIIYRVLYIPGGAGFLPSTVIEGLS